MTTSPLVATVDTGLYGRVLRRGLPWILLPALVGAALGWGIGALVTPAYSAHARVLVTQIAGLTQVSGQRSVDPGLNLDTEAQLATSNSVAAPVGDALGLEAWQVRRKTSITVPPNSAVLVVTYTDSSPERAVTGADGLAKSYLQQRTATAEAIRTESTRQVGEDLTAARTAANEAESRAAKTKTGTVDATLAQLDVQAKLDRVTSLQGSLDALAVVNTSGGRVIESARQPTGPSVPNRPLLIVSLAALGLLLGLSLALLRERSNSALRTATDVRRELGVPLLGRIDATRKLIRDEQLEHVSRQLADLVPADAGYEIVGQHTDLVHAAVAELTPPPVRRPSLGQRYAVLVLSAGDARSAPARVVMDGVANRGYRVVGAVVVERRSESGGDDGEGSPSPARGTNPGEARNRAGGANPGEARDRAGG
jgi:capsular polysaccharide biosynthesis protein